MKTSKGIALLDVSVLVPLFCEDHVHHEAAHDWFADNAAAGWASCPVTENGLFRILSNPARVERHVPLPELVGLLKRFCDHSHHHFWPDVLSFRDPRSFNVPACHGHQQLTDVYLLALAVKQGGRLATFDQRIPLAAVRGATRAALEVITPE